ncbi:hypothetical protein BHYA_0227g00030 [Botrytis hyacinthi]|uniref:Heterokaryon incompatibility domain-containing protein n=1 Tax=Botrytis hyacinthi TaxID=278943 RepID=A0A4Z1GIV9_9HELO|nr:hypothetical protein BHYA_0227g00030 [Botrytis hyacinthi]
MEEELPEQIPEVEDNIKFKYSDCQIRSRTEIRILNLLPPIKSNLDTLHCTLSVAKLEDKPLYEAVSYVWGPPVFPERLYLPSGYLSITTNLAAALRQFRYSDRHQVQLMSQLYQNTKRTLAWLGKEHSNTQGFFGKLEMMAAEHQLFEINRDDSFFEVFQKLRELPPEDQAGSEILHLAYSISPSIITLIQLPWFERLWIIQEAVLPGKVQVFWGRETLDLDTLILSMKVYLTLARKSSTFEFSRIWIPLIFLNDLRENFHSILTGHGGNKTRLFECNLFDIVANFSPLKACYNDMDKIFGLLGLKSNDDFGFEVNYEGTVESVYFEFALKALESIDLEVFLQESLRIRDSTSHLRQGIPVRLPSWVPDWRCTQSGGKLSLEGFQSATSLPKCLSYDKESLPFIGLGGVRVDIIADDLSTIFAGRDDLHSLENIWNSHPAHLITLKEFLLKHLPTDKSLTIEDVTKNFVGTILSEMAILGSMKGIPQVENGLEGLYTWWMNFESAHGNKTDSSNLPVNLESLNMPRESYRRGGNFIITETGHLGIGPILVKRGDIVAIFDGLRMPIVLRPALPDQSSRPPVYSPNKEQVFLPDEQWELVGNCYLHGFMNNEVAEPQWREKSEKFWIT